MSIADLEIMFGVLFGLSILIGVVCGVVVAAKKRSNASKPIVEGVVRVADIQQVTVAGVAPMSQILFEFEDGNRVKLYVDQTHHYVVGDKGYLKYQGNELISFERDT